MAIFGFQQSICYCIWYGISSLWTICNCIWNRKNYFIVFETVFDVNIVLANYLILYLVTEKFTLLLPTGFDHMTVHFSSGTHDLPAMLVRHPLVQPSQIVSVLVETRTGDPRFESDQVSILPLRYGYWDKILGQSLSILSLFPHSDQSASTPKDRWSLFHWILQRTQLFWRVCVWHYFCLLDLITWPSISAVVHMTCQQCSCDTHWYSHLKLCPCWSRIEPGTPDLRDLPNFTKGKIVTWIFKIFWISLNFPLRFSLKSFKLMLYWI